MRVTIDKTSGLRSEAVESRLLKFGYNELPTDKKKNIAESIREIILEPMVGLLLACGGIYFFLGDKLEAMVLSISVLGVVLITLYQARKSEKSLQALKDLSNPKAFVIREGVERRVPSREVVPEDIVILLEGDRVPADATLLESTNLKIDESLLTGESVPVLKHVGGKGKEGKVFSGSLVVKGHAIAQVTATGVGTGIGKIGKSLDMLSIEKTLLQKEVSRVIKYVALGGLFLCIILVAVYAVTKGDVLSGFLAGLTMAMGILPEEFPIVLILFISMGAWRLARNQVLSRRAATIETLGAATVLCVDKTGTITENRMDVEEIYQNKDINITEKSYPLDEVTYYAVLASQKKPFDPMETAFISIRKKVFGDLSEVYKDMELIGEYPVNDKSLAIVHVWSTKEGKKHEVAAKGAPEAIFELCGLSNKEITSYEIQVKKMAEKGLRVLAVARGEYIGKNLPKDRKKFSLEFLGLVGLADPVRSQIAHAIRECYSAGIRVIMITGDYPVTAENIADKIGLTSPGGVLTGEELDRISDKQLMNKIQHINIFSRVLPEHKLRIVEALKNDEEIVAMTGDGVNDAPALKSANIGIAMGQRGTDVAREAAALVLLDDNFSSIVGGVKLGRRIFDNLKKAMKYILSIHVPIAGLSLVPVLLGWPLFMYPIHIVLLELIIDPACTLVFEAEEEEVDIMDRKPRKVGQSIFGKGMLLASLIEGAVILTITLLSYKLTLDLGWAVDKARAFTFLILLAANVLLILSNRSETESALRKLLKGYNAHFLVIALLVFLVTALIYLFPTANGIFLFKSLTIIEIVIALGLGAISIAWLEIVKFVKRTF